MSTLTSRSPRGQHAGLDNAAAAKQWSRDLVTIAGFNIQVRPARPTHQKALEAFDHVSRYAASRGIEKLHAIHCSRDYGATALEREVGFMVRASHGDPSLLVAAKGLVPEQAGSA